MILVESGQSDSDSSLLFTVCIVVFDPQPKVIEATITTLGRALLPFGLERAKLFIVDNSPQENTHDWLRAVPPGLAVEVLSGHGNIGYGRANNLVLHDLGLFHLVLNPDVEMEEDAFVNAIAFMADNLDCGLLTPAAFHPDGQRQYLCKRYPSVFDLLLRGFAPRIVRRVFQQRLNRYEMRDLNFESVIWMPPIVSGCFMLFRSVVFRELGGFDPRYLLYFEDFDLSLRAGRITRIAYVPAVRIVHGGGGAARKGLWHIYQFARSACIFFASNTFKLS